MHKVLSEPCIFHTIFNVGLQISMSPAFLDVTLRPNRQNLDSPTPKSQESNGKSPFSNILPDLPIWKGRPENFTMTLALTHAEKKTFHVNIKNN